LRRDQPLTLDEILAAARSITRRDGLDGLSLRKVADELQVAPSALYNHVSSKRDLLEQLLVQVWDTVFDAAAAAPVADPLELAIQANLAIRRAWLDNIDLAPLAFAVADVDDRFYETNQLFTLVLEACRFPDVPRAYHAIQTFVMGSVALAANRTAASAFFGRHPDEVLDAAHAQLDERHASANLRGVTEARFDMADDEHFETSLRLLVESLLRPDDGSADAADRSGDHPDPAGDHASSS
jgi:AcrR family transcriptional regulator